MLILACTLVFLSVTLLIGAFGSQVTLAPRRSALRRLEEDLAPTTYEETLQNADVLLGPREKARWWHRILPGARDRRDSAELTIVSLKPDTDLSRTLLYAGYHSQGALRSFQMSRIVCALVMGVVPLVLAARGIIPAQRTALAFLVSLILGYVAPKFFLKMKARKRQHRLKLSLPDALDLLVVCVEAGMGLNQAIVRVSEELRHTHPEIADEFRLVNLEIRAGKTRHEALRSLGERTGVDDIISLTAMIVQTDRFGTSIARSLRVHSDSLRVERRQRAEEAAAKTTIKLIFPLVFCIFPALFVIILGPAALHLYKVFVHQGVIQ